jgi:poly-gamma-glutamate synthesis protein (capsule biosynthesis protein)
MDYGIGGLLSTINFSKINNLETFGAGLSFKAAYEPLNRVLNNKKIALFAFSEAQFGALTSEFNDISYGYAWLDHPLSRINIIKARKSSDFIIVQVHAGLEMVDLPLPEWRDRFRELIDLGADLIICHHPHVIQGCEEYKGKKIYYSIGNLFMDFMNKPNSEVSGGLINVTVTKDKINSEFIAIKYSKNEIDLDRTPQAHELFLDLSRRLTNEKEYLRSINSICKQFWKKNYSGYYEYALNGVGIQFSVLKIFKLLLRIIKKLLNINNKSASSNKLMLIHNTRIESHRWAIDRALSIE